MFLHVTLFVSMLQGTFGTIRLKDLCFLIV